MEDCDDVMLTSLMPGDQDRLMVPTLKSGVTAVTGGPVLLPHLDLVLLQVQQGLELEKDSLALVNFVVVVVPNSAGPCNCTLF